MPPQLQIKLPKDKEKLLLALFHKGKFSTIIQQVQDLRLHFPKDVFLLNILGASYAHCNDFTSAIETYSQAISISPKDAELHFNLGRAKKMTGDIDGALTSYQQALRLNPRNATIYNNIGNLWLSKGNLPKAVDNLQMSIKYKSDFAFAHFNLGCAFQAQQRFDDAIDSYNKAILHKPDYFEAQHNLGVVCFEVRNFVHARKAFEAAIKINPNFALSYNSLGNLERAMGNRERAKVLYIESIKKQTNYAEPYYHYTSVEKVARTDPIFKHILDKRMASLKGSPDRMFFDYALAQIEFDNQNAQAGMQYLISANSNRKCQLNYTFNKDVTIFNNILKYFNSDIGDMNLRIESFEPQPIFIVGMPRSGTTLVEQIIAAHPDVTALGELEYMNKSVHESGWYKQKNKNKNKTIINIRDRYLKYLENDGNPAFFTDKMPLNFRWIGFIKKAFPHAKIVHITRKPAAICWSNFKTYFPAEGMAFTFDMQDIAHYYILYNNMMKFWQKVFPRAIYSLNYEKLTESPEDEAQQLFHYLGLRWDRSYLDIQKQKSIVTTASSMQVRNKIYQGSSDSWEAYQAFLKPMIEILDS
ncbi:tetratricopeptide repeat-containing sulfotransferase family protein [Candidatus Puniceispirillum marinum]|uniref:TPR repeat protein n=1 Tax=Puniceispirillum marinum (strain IMCC1322) TaxID=488538 RepID=D5BTF4_PUNMI|nr:sulfotransferase [Candidatus Puniceispirillum marinum]ADE39551.1 TPR repeat protein [Candidatus Puniceispirillum marinum IMCC1322]